MVAIMDRTNGALIVAETVLEAFAAMLATGQVYGPIPLPVQAPEVPPNWGEETGTENEIRAVAVVAVAVPFVFVIEKLNINGAPTSCTGPGERTLPLATTLKSIEAAPAITFSFSPPEMVCVEPPPTPCTLKLYVFAAVTDVVVTTNVTVTADPFKAMTLDG